MKDLAIQVDAGYPDNADLVIEEDGRPSRKARDDLDAAIGVDPLTAGLAENHVTISLDSRSDN